MTSLKHFFFSKNILYLITFFVFSLVLIPLITIFFSFFQETSEYFNLLKDTFLHDYISNTLAILFSVLLLTFILGVSSAYLVTFYSFPGVNFFKLALILSFAIPPYIYGYALSAFFENFGTAYIILNSFFGDYNYNNLIPKFNGILGATLSLSFSLFGYVYIFVRSSFVFQSKKLIEVGESLGFNKKKIFFNVILPSSRPAIIAGMSLVAMEVISDFGTVSFFGVSTFTTGIYNAWISFDDLSSANRLSFTLLGFVLLFFLIEKKSRKNAKYHNVSREGQFDRLKVRKLSGVNATLAFLFCSTLLFVSFIFPFSQMVFWTYKFPQYIYSLDILRINLNTLSLVSITSIIIIFFGFFINYSNRILKRKFLEFLTFFSISGYAIPGVILSVSLISFSSFIKDKTNIDIVFIGSIYGLIIAYFIRFFSISYNGIKSSYLKINKSIDESAYLIGFSKFNTLTSIHLTFLKKPIFLIGILISIEVLKELPITLILRPFNFDTFSTIAFSYADQDLIEAAAFPSLCLILWTTLLIMLSSKFLLSEKF